MNDPDELRKYAERMKRFIKNRSTFPPDDLLKYADHWIAWSPDGSAIVAGHKESPPALSEMLRLEIQPEALFRGIELG